MVIFVNTFLLTNTTHKHITPRNGERGLVTLQMNNQPIRVGIAATITALQMAKWAQSDEDDDDDDGEGEEATEEKRCFENLRCHVTSPPEMYEVNIVFRYLNKTAKTLLTDGRVM